MQMKLSGSVFLAELIYLSLMIYVVKVFSGLGRR